MNVIDLKKYLNPRRQAYKRAKDFVKNLEKNNLIQDDTITVAIGLRSGRFFYALFGAGCGAFQRNK